MEKYVNCYGVCLQKPNHSSRRTKDITIVLDSNSKGGLGQMVHSLNTACQKTQESARIILPIRVLCEGIGSKTLLKSPQVKFVKTGFQGTADFLELPNCYLETHEQMDKAKNAYPQLNLTADDDIISCSLFQSYLPYSSKYLTMILTNDIGLKLLAGTYGIGTLPEGEVLARIMSTNDSVRKSLFGYSSSKIKDIEMDSEILQDITDESSLDDIVNGIQEIGGEFILGRESGEADLEIYLRKNRIQQMILWYERNSKKTFDGFIENFTEDVAERNEKKKKAAQFVDMSATDLRNCFEEEISKQSWGQKIQALKKSINQKIHDLLPDRNWRIENNLEVQEQPAKAEGRSGPPQPKKQKVADHFMIWELLESKLDEM